MSESNIKEIVEAAIKTQILSAFNEGPDLIEKLVSAALREPVKDHSSYRTTPFIDHLIGDTVRSAAQRAVLEVFAERENEVKELVRKSLNAEDIVNAYTKSLMEAMSNEWRVKVTLEKFD